MPLLSSPPPPLLFPSLPVDADLLETCLDDVLRAPVDPTETAADEAGPSSAYAAAGDDPLCLAGEATENLEYHRVENTEQRKVMRYVVTQK